MPGVRELLLSRTLGNINDSEASRNGKKAVYVFHANPSCCPRCRAMDGRVVQVSNPALITHPACKCSITKEYR